jgi:hypothetical protein
MEKELLELLERADPKDFVECLKENYQKHGRQHFNMLSEMYWNKKHEFKMLSAGCQAAAIVYLHTANTRGNLWEKTL